MRQFNAVWPPDPMNKIFRSFLLVTLLVSSVYAKDGIFLSDIPPVVVRFSKWGFEVTNTSDAIIHAVTLTSVTNGQKKSEVISNTLLPHTTLTLAQDDLAHTVNKIGFIKESKRSITCKDYSKPLLIDGWWAEGDFDPSQLGAVEEKPSASAFLNDHNKTPPKWSEVQSSTKWISASPEEKLKLLSAWIHTVARYGVQDHGEDWQQVLAKLDKFQSDQAALIINNPAALNGWLSQNSVRDVVLSYVSSATRRQIEKQDEAPGLQAPRFEDTVPEDATYYKIPEISGELSILKSWVPTAASTVKQFNADMLRARPQTTTRYVAGFTRGAPTDGSLLGKHYIWIQKTPCPATPITPEELAAMLPKVAVLNKAEFEEQLKDKVKTIDAGAAHYDAALGCIIYDTSPTLADGTIQKTRTFLFITKQYGISFSACSSPDIVATVFREVGQMVSSFKVDANAKMPASWVEQVKELLGNRH